MTEVSLRSATEDDVGAMATVWHAGWPEGHLGNVPDELVNHRSRLTDFVRLVTPHIATTTVAISNGVIGFVTIHDDEVEQIYVAQSARGTGAATALLSHAEATIAERFDLSWLAVVAGNVRARRFYARQGWRDAGLFDYYAEIDGGRFAVPCQQVRAEEQGLLAAGVGVAEQPLGASLGIRAQPVADIHGQPDPPTPSRGSGVRVNDPAMPVDLDAPGGQPVISHPESGTLVSTAMVGG